MKIIFIDIDGVLVTSKSKWNLRAGRFDFAIELVYNLKKIVAETKAFLVLSSDWRFNGFKEMNKLFKEHGLFLFDHTELNSQHDRGTHIQRWLDTCGHDIENYIAIDDDVSIRILGEHAVLTILDEGLNAEIAEIAIEKLNSTLKGNERGLCSEA